MESSLEKTQRVNLLIDCYGDLLTNKQQLYLQYYYQEDYSLSEIAEIMHVSRNAVYDNLKKAVRSLEKYEEKLQRIEDDITDENKELENYLEMLRKI